MSDVNPFCVVNCYGDQPVPTTELPTQPSMDIPTKTQTSI